MARDPDRSVVIRFNDALLRIPQHLFGAFGALQKLQDSRDTCDPECVDITLPSIVAPQDALNLVLHLLQGGSSAEMTEDQWHVVAQITDFLDIGPLHTPVIDYYKTWFVRDCKLVRELYVEEKDLAAKIDVRLAQRALCMPVETGHDVFKLVQQPGTRWDFETLRDCNGLLTVTKAFHAVTTLPDGRLAVALIDYSIKLLNVDTRVCTATLAGHLKHVRTLSVLRDGRLVSGSDDKTIKLWSTLTGECTATLKGHTDTIYSVTPLPDGRLASLCFDGFVKLWNIVTNECTASLRQHSLWPSTLAVLLDGRLACASCDNSINLWDTMTTVCTARLKGHACFIMSLAVLHDGRLFSASFDGCAKLWDTNTRTCLYMFEPNQHKNFHCFRNPLVMPSGHVMWGSMIVGTVILLNTSTGINTIVKTPANVFITGASLLHDGRAVLVEERTEAAMHVLSDVSQRASVFLALVAKKVPSSFILQVFS